MLQQFLSHLSLLVDAGPKSTVLVAVSGGIDSMVMLHMFRQSNVPFAVAHCNFCLRGDASDEDEQFVESYCEAASIPFYAKRFETLKYAREKKISVQMAARELRYGWFFHLLNEHGFSNVATAHQASDVVETVLLNLLRGSGVSGLSGIPLQNGKIIRPILFATRQQVAQFAIEHKVKWREDESNHEDHYQRNFIRHHVLPSLRELNPAVDSNILNTATRLADSQQIILQFVNAFREQAVEDYENRMEIHLPKLKAIKGSPALLWELLKVYGFAFDTCMEILRDHQPGKKFLSRTHRVTIDRELLIVDRCETSGQEPIFIQESSFEAAGFGRELTGRLTGHPGVINPDPAVAQLDFDSLIFPLTWRHWREGDQFVPLGMSHHKKVSDFLIDIKTPGPDKEGVTVLLSADEIVWVVGMRIADRAKITPATHRVLDLRVLPIKDN